jgi:Ran GTPase-activating protein (RanGAP) involved in mRNA processing and transport
MASTPTPKTLSLHGKGLKLNTREDIVPYLKDIDPTLLEEIHLGGNTIGVDASQALAEFLAKTQVLKVRKKKKIDSFNPELKLLPSRLLISRTFSQVV